MQNHYITGTSLYKMIKYQSSKLGFKQAAGLIGLFVDGTAAPILKEVSRKFQLVIPTF